ncbi:MAG: 2-aminoethylphosphonate aminotransferase [Omnitrophica WOR_2 bacterium SM23_29]|nr:MAG: 2-aminoethylphosphonate aminotransferase [Omnitrophica WOR_2 bacterium SM23_29]
MKRHILLTPGPVNIKENIRRALLKPDICHREAEFSKILLGCRKKLLKVFKVENSHDVVFFSGSGTAAVEAAVISSVPRGKKILVINNGVYAERMTTIARRHKIAVINLKFDITKRPDIGPVERRIKADKEIAVVAMVHHETSTGLLNPVDEIGRLCKRYGVLYLLDSVSSLGGEKLSFKKTPVDLCVGVANKCIEGIPGISFVLIKKKAIAKIERIQPRSLYFDIISNLRLQRKGDVAFTPAVQSFYSFDIALDELIKEGVEKRVRRYKNTAALLRKGFADLGLRNLIDPTYHSNTVTALYLPGGLHYKNLHDTLKKKGFVIYAGQAKLKDVIFRVANMGQVKAKDIRRFLTCLKTILSR